VWAELATRRESSGDLLDDAKALLAHHGTAAARVYRVESAGDSGEGRETILFTSPDGEPMTAFLETVPGLGEEFVTVAGGW
jgi:hypothetical protein